MMTIIRRELRSHFTIVPNAIFLDKRLSIEAKGVLGFLLSHPHNWQVRLDHVGRTLRIGRKKLQRIFRELISAGYVTREQQRIQDGHRFGEIDYVVRNVSDALCKPVDNSAIPEGPKGPAAPRVQNGPAYKEAPWVPIGPTYKEISYKNRETGSSAIPAEKRRNLGVAQERLPRTLDAARFDAEIVALFDDVAEGWELLSALPFEVLSELRELKRCGDLDRIAIRELRARYRHLLAGGSQSRPPKKSPN
jgi:hypothetical protein